MEILNSKMPLRGVIRLHNGWQLNFILIFILLVQYKCFFPPILKFTNQLLTFKTLLSLSLLSSHTLNYQSLYQVSNYSVNRLLCCRLVMPATPPPSVGSLRFLLAFSSSPTMPAYATFPRFSPQLKNVVFENSGLKLIYFFWEEGPWLPRVEEIMNFSHSSLQMQQMHI